MVQQGHRCGAQARGGVGQNSSKGEQEREGAAGVWGTESSSTGPSPSQSLALLSLAGSLGLFQETLHTARHFPATPTGSKTKPTQQQPLVNRLGSEEALNRTKLNSRKRVSQRGGDKQSPPAPCTLPKKKVGNKTRYSGKRPKITQTGVQVH